MAILKLVAERLSVKFNYDPATIQAIKAIPGAHWSPRDKTWTVPMSIDNCLTMREIFGEDLNIAKSVSQRFLELKSEPDKIKQLLAMPMHSDGSGVELRNVETLAPSIHRAVTSRSYQSLAIKYGATVGNFLLADQPGLGKTLEALGALVEAGITGWVLIAAPRTSLRATWLREIERWMADYKYGYTVDVIDGESGTLTNRNLSIMKLLSEPINNGQLRFICINPEMARAQRINGKVNYKVYAIGSHNWDAVIVDESHRYLQNANSRSRSVSAVGLGLSKLQSKRRIAISGTPMRGKPRKIWGTLAWLDPEKYTSEWRWSAKYFAAEFNHFTGHDQITDEMIAGKESDFYNEISMYMIRRTKAELHALNPAWAPPGKQYYDVWLPMGKHQKDLYDQMLKNAEVELKGKVMTANGVLAVLTRLKQFASCCGEMAGEKFVPTEPSNKIDWIVDTFIPSRETKIVIASQFASIIRALSSRLEKENIEHLLLTGETPDKIRQGYIDEFQNGNCQIFLISTTAGGVSITLDAADDMVIMDETWIPDDQEQLEDRIHRTSRVNHQVFIHYLRSLDTIESDIAHVVSQRDGTQKMLIDGQRGIEFAQVRLGVQVE